MSPAPVTARRHRPVRFGAMALVAALLLGLGACSSPDEPPPVGPQGTTPVLTPEAYIAQANEVCADADNRITALTNSDGPVNNNAAGPAQDQVKKLIESITPIAQRAISTLRNLTPPPRDADALRAGIDRMQQTLDAAQTDPTGPINPIGLPDEKLFTYGITRCYSNG